MTRNGRAYCTKLVTRTKGLFFEFILPDSTCSKYGSVKRCLFDCISSSSLLLLLGSSLAWLNLRQSDRRSSWIGQRGHLGMQWQWNYSSGDGQLTRRLSVIGHAKRGFRIVPMRSKYELGYQPCQVGRSMWNASTASVCLACRRYWRPWAKMIRWPFVWMMIRTRLWSRWNHKVSVWRLNRSRTTLTLNF